MSKYRLTILFIIFSVLTLGTAALALNHLTARAAENNLVELTTEQSMRDASIIAGVVNQLLDNQETGSAGEPAGLTGAVSIESQELLDSLGVIDISLYDSTGRGLWSTSTTIASVRTIPRPIIESAENGRITSNLGAVDIRSDGTANSAGSTRQADVIKTFLPLLAGSGDDVVGVIGITRDVTTTLTTQIAETRSSVSLITLLSLGGVFLVLLTFIFVADVAIFRASTRRIRYERELADRLMLDSLELKRVGQAKDRFLSSITHELMTPLTSITAFTGILMKNRDGNLGRTDIKHLQVMKRNAVQLQQLLDNLLELSVMNKGEYELSYTRFNLRHTLDEVTGAFIPAITRKGQRFELKYEDTDAIVEADDGRIRQVVSNLLTNAIMYSPEGTEITVSAWVSDLLFTITISDNGIGISNRDKEELFTLFFRVDNESTRAVPGTGIGLVSAKQIVELHRGELTLDSTPGEGTTLQLSVPRFRSRHSLESRIDGAA